MPFTSPLALLGLLFIPAVLAMYMLKLRRDRAVVPSTLLWSRLLTDVEANAPWQKLRRSLLLLLQLLLVVIITLLAARPFLERPAGLAGDIVLIVDTSASMAATDVAPTRLDAAKAAAIEALRDLPTGGTVSVIAADRTARIVVNESKDLGRVRQAIGDLQPSTMAGDLGDALELASKLAARSGQAQVLVATDAAIATVPDVDVDAPITVLPVGRDRKNQAIVAMAVRTASSAVTRSVFVGVANLDLESAQRRLEVWGDGQLLEARDLQLDAQARSDVVIDDVPDDVRSLEVRLVAPGATAVAAPDQLAIDDRAWAVIPPDRKRLILVVGKGDPYLETALSYLPNVELFGVTPDEYGPATARKDGRPWDLVIFEGALPATLPDSPILAIAPPRTSPLGELAGTLKNPGIGSLKPDEPILRYVDLTTTHIAEAAKLVLPDWARTVIPGPKGAPLLYAGVRGGLPTAVLAFEPRQSDLPLQVAFPILLANLTGELLGGSAAPTEAVAPGTPVTLTIPSGAVGLDRHPPGRVHDGPRRPRDGRRDADVRPDRAPRHLHRHARPRSERLGRPSGRRRRRRAVRWGERQPATRRGPVRPDTVRRGPLRRRRIDDRSGVRLADRGSRDGARRLTRAGFGQREHPGAGHHPGRVVGPDPADRAAGAVRRVGRLPP